MIVAALLALVVQGTDAFAHLTVRTGDRTTSVPVVLMGAPMVRADLLAAAIGGELRPLGSDRWELRAGGATLELTSGVPFVQNGTETIPLSVEPAVRDHHLFVPYQFVSEILPRVATNVAFDATRGELRLMEPPPRSRVADRPPAAESPVAAVPPRPSEPPRGAHRRVVVVDAGHGGPDRGMTGTLGNGERVFEKDITLAVARALRRSLTDRGTDVVMTRDADTLIALSDRGRIANQRKGDVFVSIHVNAANPHWHEPTASRGFETYFLSEAKSEDERRVESMENEVVKYEVSGPSSKNDPLSYVLHDMEQNEHLRESLRFAEIVQRRIGTMHPGPDRGVKQAGFRVLVTALMPAILVEIGFGSNEREATWMSDPAKQRDLATAIADATLEYLERYERRSSAGAAPAGAR